MSRVQTTTALDLQPLAKDVPRLTVVPGLTLRLLVIAAGGSQCAGVDVRSGALVRAWCADRPRERLRAYDVVEGTVAIDPDGVPDPAEPEAVVLDGPPEVVGRMRGRKAARLLRPLLHPRGQPLLGSNAPAIAFWERRPDHPSIGLVEPEGPVLLLRQGTFLACRFGWQGLPRELPCLDRRLAARMDHEGRSRHACEKGDRLVVALTPPIEGRCHKVVEAILPRP
jgi:hypothetical protein